MSISWCETEGQQAAPYCFDCGHTVVVMAQDPAVETWGEALPTSAQLRAATAEVERLRAELKRAHAAGQRLIGERDRLNDENEDLSKALVLTRNSREFNRLRADDLRAENNQLRAQLESLPGYHLTDKGLAAIAQPETE